MAHFRIRPPFKPYPGLDQLRTRRPSEGFTTNPAIENFLADSVTAFVPPPGHVPGGCRLFPNGGGISGKLCQLQDIPTARKLPLLQAGLVAPRRCDEKLPSIGYHVQRTFNLTRALSICPLFRLAFHTCVPCRRSHLRRPLLLCSRAFLYLSSGSNPNSVAARFEAPPMPLPAVDSPASISAS